MLFKLFNLKVHLNVDLHSTKIYRKCLLVIDFDEKSDSFPIAWQSIRALYDPMVLRNSWQSQVYGGFIGKVKPIYTRQRA